MVVKSVQTWKNKSQGEVLRCGWFPGQETILGTLPDTSLALWSQTLSKEEILPLCLLLHPWNLPAKPSFHVASSHQVTWNLETDLNKWHQMHDFMYMQRGLWKGPASLSSGSTIKVFFCIWTTSAVFKVIHAWAQGLGVDGFISSTLCASDSHVLKKGLHCWKVEKTWRLDWPCGV